MSLIRWALSILAFPIGGWIAFQVVGPVTSPLTAAAAAAVAGVVIGAANVIAVNIDSGFVTFGLSGALLVTVVTAAVLRRILGPVTRPATKPAAKPAGGGTHVPTENLVEVGR